MRRTRMNRGSKPMPRGAGFRKRGDLSGSLSAQVYGLSNNPQKAIARTSMKQRRPKRGPSIDGDDLRTIREDCDQIVREIIKLRDTLCISCGLGGLLEVGHLWRRGKSPVRFHLQNCNGQHSICNRIHNEDQSDYIGGFVQRYGEAAFHELKTLSNWQGKLQYTDMLAIRDGLRDELQKLKTTHVQLV